MNKKLNRNFSAKKQFFLMFRTNLKKNCKLVQLLHTPDKSYICLISYLNNKYITYMAMVSPPAPSSRLNILRKIFLHKVPTPSMKYFLNIVISWARIASQASLSWIFFFLSFIMLLNFVSGRSCLETQAVESLPS